VTTTAPRVGDTITTAEQLDALPDGVIVMLPTSKVPAVRFEDVWFVPGFEEGQPSSGLRLPTTVLYVPGEQPADRPSVTDNARAETTTGAIARGEALAAGDPDWMNVTRWPRTEAETTTVILRLIEDNRRMRHGSLCPECNAKAWGERADFRRERDELAAKVAAVEALADETERAGDPLLRLDRLRAALTEVTADTTTETP